MISHHEIIILPIAFSEYSGCLHIFDVIYYFPGKYIDYAFTEVLAHDHKTEYYFAVKEQNVVLSYYLLYKLFLKLYFLYK